MNHRRKNRRVSKAIFTGAATAAMILSSALLTVTPAEAAVRIGGVDMQRACNTQYPASWGLAAHVNDQNNAYSWRCWASWDHSTYGIDVNRECVTQYGAGAYAGLVSKYNPYSWYCQR
jgi:hypothetical protein